jgi:hypothetical protein
MVTTAKNTADSPADVRIHVHHLAVVRLGKAALVAAIEAGAVLQQERNRRGDEFVAWVNTCLGLTPSEAACFIRFFEKSGMRPDRLSPAVEVKLPRVLELLGQLNTAFGKGAAPALPAGTTERDGRRQPKANGSTKVREAPAKRDAQSNQGTQPQKVTNQPAKASTRARKRTTTVSTRTRPVQHSRNDRQSALTPEQRQFLVRRSPRLFARVRKGELTPEHALRLAQDKPDRFQR